jgi:uncharacterized lipoprotein YehR (DUF1307 family)
LFVERRRIAMHNYRKVFSIIVALLVVVGLAACGSQQQANDEPDYADDEVIAAIAKGLEARSDVIYSQTAEVQDSSDGLKAAVNAEYNVISPFKDRQYQDSKLQEVAISYINSVSDQISVLDTYSYGSTEFYEKWEEVYNKRTTIIKELADNYSLALDENHQSVLDDLVKDGGVAAQKSAADEAINSLISNATFEQTDEGYGNYTYSAVIENTSEFTFNNVSVILGIYDADGVRVEEDYANSATPWAPGEKIKLSAYGQTNAQQIKPTVQYYDIVE